VLPVSIKIAIALTIAVACIFASLWQISNVRGVKSRGRRRAPAGSDSHGQRSSDTRKLSRLGRKLYNEAQKLLEQGKVPAAATILEQLSMQREAIQVLEDHGFIHDAAKMLMRMQRHNRAGVIYARHGLWEHAAQCFKMANMPAEVAKCAREFGDLAMASEFFEKAQRYTDAAECCEELGDNLRGARLFLLASQSQRAMSAFARAAAKNSNSKPLDLRTSELQQIAAYLSEGRSDTNLAQILKTHGRLVGVIIKQLEQGMSKQAAELIKSVKSDIIPQIMSEINYRDQSAHLLAEILVASGHHNYAGNVYEQLLVFDKAAVAFEKANDMQRAQYCYERHGVSGKGRASRVMPEMPKIGTPKANTNHTSALPQPVNVRPTLAEFALSDLTEDGRRSLEDVLTGKPESLKVPESLPVVPPQLLNLSPPADPPQLPAPKQVAVLSPSKEAAREDDGRSSFQKASLCAELSSEQTSALWSIGFTLKFNAGESILNYNDDPRGIYVILKGSVSCYRRIGDKEAYIDQMAAADSFGELWLLADTPSAVHFVAVRDSEIRIVDRSAFLKLLDRDAPIAQRLYRRFAKRLLDKLLNNRDERRNPLAS
jgi:tetratricopeptide (TPR) repeat protein